MESFTSHQQPANYLRQLRHRSRSFPIHNSGPDSFSLPQTDTTLGPSRFVPYSQDPSNISVSGSSISGASVLPVPASSEITPLGFQLPATTDHSLEQIPATDIFSTDSDSQSVDNLLNYPIQGVPSDNMSALGIQYDNRYHGSPKMSYTWPTSTEMGDHYQHPRFEPGTPYSQHATIPEYARSLSSTPPRGTLGPEQRELKRQRDIARRESKSQVRRDRSTSASYVHSQSTTPDLDPRRIMAYNTSSMTSASLPTHLPLPSHSQPYMTSFNMPMSQPMNQDIYSSEFSMPSNDMSLSNYNMPFPTNTSSSAHHMYPHRAPSTSSTSDRSIMYTSPSLTSPNDQDQVRVVQQRPKPQCWEHGCNGRQFSTFSNLLRHQREKSGVAAKSSCPKCGAEFTRTTARNGHMAHEKCKSRRGS